LIGDQSNFCKLQGLRKFLAGVVWVCLTRLLEWWTGSEGNEEVDR
jgi:hypothetical protein